MESAYILRAELPRLISERRGLSPPPNKSHDDAPRSIPNNRTRIRHEPSFSRPASMVDWRNWRVATSRGSGADLRRTDTTPGVVLRLSSGALRRRTPVALGREGGEAEGRDCSTLTLRVMPGGRR